MTYVKRLITDKLIQVLNRDKSILLLGPRQTGKTTLIEQLKPDKYISLADPRQRLRYEMNEGQLIGEIEALHKEKRIFCIIDEVQKAPALMDAVQYLIDNKIAQFLLTGSSARKLKRDGDVNLLPGRVIPLHLDSLMLNELPKKYHVLEDLLMYGSLPEIILTEDKKQMDELLDAYVITYLEEEVRAEAIVRNLGNFARFLELAASEAGYPVNFNKLSQQVGVANDTVVSYYQILEDCLIVERIEPITISKTRHRLSKAQKYLFFDLGVRRLAAKEGTHPPRKYLGHLFEQFIGLELIRMARLNPQRSRLRYWRDQNGPEIDWVIEQPERLIPIEIKWTDVPNTHDAKHLEKFIEEYEETTHGFIVCQTPNPVKISDRILAISWTQLQECFE